MSLQRASVSVNPAPPRRVGLSGARGGACRSRNAVPRRFCPPSRRLVIRAVLVVPALTAVATLTPSHAAAATTPSAQALEALGDVPAATAFRYQATDNHGNVLGCLRIVPDPQGGYLGVYHTQNPAPSPYFTTHLAHSWDLLTWTWVRDLDQRAPMPALQFLSDGSALVVFEHNVYNQYIQLRFEHYRNRGELLQGSPDRRFDAPLTQSPYGEGTPMIMSARLTPNLANSIIDVTFHYFQNGDVDRQAEGTLTNFSTWSTWQLTQIDAAIGAAGVAGDIGARSPLTLGGQQFRAQDGQLNRWTKGVPSTYDWGSWRLFLYDLQTSAATPLNVQTHGGSLSISNPNVVVLTLPNGHPGIMASYFFYSSNNASGEAGQLLFYRQLDGPPFATSQIIISGYGLRFVDGREQVGATLTSTNASVVANSSAISMSSGFYYRITTCLNMTLADGVHPSCQRAIVNTHGATGNTTGYAPAVTWAGSRPSAGSSDITASGSVMLEYATASSSGPWTVLGRSGNPSITVPAQGS